LLRTPTLKSSTSTADALSYLAPRFAAEENPVQGSKNGSIRLAERPADKRLGIAPVEIEEFEDGQRIWCFTEWREVRKRSIYAHPTMERSSPGLYLASA
jgi:hypothetical protein